MKISHYSEIYNFGHKALLGLDTQNVVVQEKIDGSQFSFGKIDGAYFCRSKGQDQTNNTNKIFAKAKEATKGLDLVEGWIYRGECLDRPKHNTLKYDRVPKKNVIIYDIDTADQCYLSPHEVELECKRLDLECVPCFYEGPFTSIDDFKKFLSTTSILGETLIEGIVIKAYSMFGQDKKVIMAKLVRPEFKEQHNKEWKRNNPGETDVIKQIAMDFCTPARWEKAVQHLRDEGQLQNDVADIGPLLKEIQLDVIKECKEMILERLWKLVWPKIGKLVTKGFPEWYKEKLIQHFEDNYMVERKEN